MDQMTAAETAVQAAAESLSADIQNRLQTADTLPNRDREVILGIARGALQSFQPNDANGPPSLGADR
jgi:F-type H+-transporting ATPase subunit alpha